MIQSIEDMMIRNKSKDLCLQIYSLFKNNKDFGFKDQIQRASVSIMNNIAEGFERKGNKEFKHFLYIAKGSAGEVRSMLHLSIELGYVDGEVGNNLLNSYKELAKMIAGFIKSLV